MKITVTEKNEGKFRDLVLQLKKADQDKKDEEQKQLAAVLQDFSIGR